MSKSFALKQRVYYEDTDAVGIVYHSNFLNFMERARSSWLWELGLCFDDLAKRGLGFAVHHVDIDYKKPLRLKDEFIVTCAVDSHGKTSMTFKQTIRDPEDDSILYSTALIRIVCITFEGRPKPIPHDFLEKII